MSDRLSMLSPRACSGLMYAAVPTTKPVAVPPPGVLGPGPSSPPAGSGALVLAMPKSITLTVPVGVTLMLAGFKSRWTMPLSCAASRASAI